MIEDIYKRLRPADRGRKKNDATYRESPDAQAKNQTSVDAGSLSINTLYNLLLIAGPIFRSVSAPFRFADFCPRRAISYLLLTKPP